MRKDPKESDILRAILKWLEYKRIMAWRNNTTGIYDPSKGVFRNNSSRRGVPDIIGVLPNGQFLGIEVKSKSGTVSSHQELFIREALDNNALVFVARCLDDVIERLNACEVNANQVSKTF